MPSNQEYIYMVTNKTGGLFRLSVLLMQSMSTEADLQGYIAHTKTPLPRTLPWAYA